jgi:hypothetical protein
MMGKTRNPGSFFVKPQHGDTNNDLRWRLPEAIRLACAQNKTWSI